MKISWPMPGSRFSQAGKSPAGPSSRSAAAKSFAGTARFSRTPAAASSRPGNTGRNHSRRSCRGNISSHMNFAIKTLRTFMSLTIGTQLGSHEITALLGKGGMGEVYRARDTKLKRDVAIKILPDEFSRDADRVSRFQREAEVLASLNRSHLRYRRSRQHTIEGIVYN